MPLCFQPTVTTQPQQIASGGLRRQNQCAFLYGTFHRCNCEPQPSPHSLIGWVGWIPAKSLRNSVDYYAHHFNYRS